MSGESNALSTTGLCFSYGGRNTVDNVDLQLQPGTLTALVGPNGAGKSTLLHLLEGRLKPSQGAINASKPWNQIKLRKTSKQSKQGKLQRKQAGQAINASHYSQNK